MSAIINRSDTPSHLFEIPELNFSHDLFAERLPALWIRLGAQTMKRRRNQRGVEDEVSRQSILLSPGDFAALFSQLESIGNVTHSLGKPGGVVHQRGGNKEYKYAPFHLFEFPFTSVTGEPLVFPNSDTSRVQLFINPDLWLFLELEERTVGTGIWWDPRRGVDALIRRTLDEGDLEIVEIRSDYLLKYLQARQASLVIGHYRQLLLFSPSQTAAAAFVKGDLILGAPEQGAKAILQNWGLRRDRVPYLQRRLHLWYEIKPPEIDVHDPWADKPSFDPYVFTLATREGLVAPARWKNLRDHGEERTFEGGRCDFMDRVFFRQEVLMKYEGASGFDVKDDGSVRCHDYWALDRTTSRIGNELVTTAIGDFAEGVPFEEWLHWKQYAVEPPGPETLKVLSQEPTIASAVNSLVAALEQLNAGFADLAASLGIPHLEPAWRGSLDSLAGRQLKWFYPATADDDEFLKRATLASTLLVDGMQSASLRGILSTVDRGLHQSFEKPPKTLGSRTLLQRVTLMALLICEFQPDMQEIPALIHLAEGKSKGRDKPDLQIEAQRAYQLIRDQFAPLAFLYELRTHGGLAHLPNKREAAAAAAKLGLPEQKWHRTDYLNLLGLVRKSLLGICKHLESV